MGGVLRPSGRSRRSPARSIALSCLLLLSTASPAQENVTSCAEERPDGPWFDRTDCVIKKEPDKRTAKDIRQVIVQNLEQSYITAGSGVRMGSDESAGNLLYEGQIVANLNWLKSEEKYLWLDVPIRLGVRQYRQSSAPVLAHLTRQENVPDRLAIKYSAPPSESFLEVASPA